MAVVVGGIAMAWGDLNSRVSGQEKQMDRDRVEMRAEMGDHYARNAQALRETRDTIKELTGTTAALAIEVARLRDSTARLERQVEILNRRTP